MIARSLRLRDDQISGCSSRMSPATVVARISPSSAFFNDASSLTVISAILKVSDAMPRRMSRASPGTTPNSPPRK